MGLLAAKFTAGCGVTCHCGRGPAGLITGTCAACDKDAARAFWDLRDGKITPAGFYRRLRRASRR